LILDLIGAGYTVYAFATDYNSSTEEQVSLLGAFPVRYRLSRGGMNPLADVWNAILLSRKLRRYNIDTVLSYFSKPVIFGTLAAVLAGIKNRFGMLEGLGYAFTKRPYGDKLSTLCLRWLLVSLYRLTLPLLDTVIFLNPDDRSDLIDSYRIKVQSSIILGGIGLSLDEFPYSPPKTDRVSFLFIGRFLAEKGIHEYIEAARLVKADFPEAEFIMLGEPDESNPGSLSRQQVSQLIDDGIIVCPGKVDNVLPWLIQCSVFVLPSYREGVPRSSQEAMAIGRPILTTDVPGCRETVVTGRNGFLVKPWSPQELANRMIFFIHNPEKIGPMGQASREIAEKHYDAGLVNKRILSLLASKKDN